MAKNTTRTKWSWAPTCKCNFNHATLEWQRSITRVQHHSSSRLGFGQPARINIHLFYNLFCDSCAETVIVAKSLPSAQVSFFNCCTKHHHHPPLPTMTYNQSELILEKFFLIISPVFHSVLGNLRKFSAEGRGVNGISALLNFEHRSCV